MNWKGIVRKLLRSDEGWKCVGVGALQEYDRQHLAECHGPVFSQYHDQHTEPPPERCECGTNEKWPLRLDWLMSRDAVFCPWCGKPLDKKEE